MPGSVEGTKAVSVNGVTLAYREQGVGEPVVLVMAGPTFGYGNIKRLLSLMRFAPLRTVGDMLDRTPTSSRASMIRCCRTWRTLQRYSMHSGLRQPI